VNFEIRHSGKEDIFHEKFFIPITLIKGGTKFNLAAKIYYDQNKSIAALSAA
jgi:hypothetical protein